MVKKISSFKDLIAWQQAYKLALMVYEITKSFPDDEKFGLANQLRRASVSVASNIAEGFSRQTKKDKIHFYHMGMGSLSEVECQLLIAQGIGYIHETDLLKVNELLVSVGRLMTGLIRSADAK